MPVIITKDEIERLRSQKEYHKCSDIAKFLYDLYEENQKLKENLLNIAKIANTSFSKWSDWSV